MSQAVRRTEEFQRIFALPRRSPTPPADLAEQMTEVLRRPAGTMRLRPLQALALHDIGICGGAFLPLDVGEGKTLVSLLAAYVLDAKRALLMLPAHLIQKTARERDDLARHWPIPNSIRLMSYQMLGLVQYERELDNYAPDLIVFDESQKAKNKDAAVTKRLGRYMAKHPDTKVVAMTGTIMRKSIRDFAHVLRWCLKEGSPLPANDHELDEWSLALDERIDNEFERMEPGALLDFASQEERAAYDEIIAARRGFCRRLIETPGVVASAPSGTEVDVGLTIRALRYDLTPTTVGHFKRLREEMVTPDDWQLMQATDVWRHSKELALGFHGVWSPRPPEDWREARRAWCAFVREVLSRSRTLDSPLHVEMAVDAGKIPRGEELLAKWRALEPTYKINTKAVWHDDSALNIAAKWMHKPGIVWVEHVPFGQRLSAMTGTKYYGAKGLADDGEFIDDADARRAAIVSVDANREGRNLQRKWSRNLVTSPGEGADLWQQMIGRTHRPGQTEDVTVDVFLGCAEHARAWQKATAGAVSIRDTVGSQNKLLIADIEWPEEDYESWGGSQWQ